MASLSCGSSASTHKSINKCESENRTKSSETNCSSNSSCFFKRRKPMNPLAYSVLKPAQHKPNPVKQRVMSAKMIKLRQLQSQLNDANYHLAEVTRENQILKTLQKRQEKAISKYENTNADLPRLIRAHEEEIRNLTERNKSLRKNVKELTDHLKLREDELSRVKDHLSRLEKLDKDKHLSEREKLLDKVENLKLQLEKSDEQVTILNRKLILESKISKQRLNAEIIKQKQQQKELIQALNEIDRLTNLLEGQENVVRPKKVFSQFGRQSMSMVYLSGDNRTNRSFSSEKLKTLNSTATHPVTEVKLEPIQAKKEETIAKNDNFMTPLDNIKQRLSNGHIEQSTTQENSHKSRPSSSIRLEKLPAVVENHKTNLKDPGPSNDREMVNEEKNKNMEFDYNNDFENSSSSDERDVDTSNLPNIQKTDSLESFEVNEEECDQENPKENYNYFDFDNGRSTSKFEDKPKPSMLKNNVTNESNYSSSERLSKVKPKLQKDNSNKPSFSSSEEETDKKISELDKAIKKATKNSREEFDKKLGEYRSQVVGSVKTCSKVIDMHKKSLKNSQQDTQTLIETFKNTARIESKLKESFFNFDEKDMGFVNEILSEEFKFKQENSDNATNGKTKNKKENLVNPENKRKLLATLRAIDNGDSIESLEENPSQTKVMKEIFGSIGN